jgi:hypothetical protein
VAFSFGVLRCALAVFSFQCFLNFRSISHWVPSGTIVETSEGRAEYSTASGQQKIERMG